MVRGFFTSGRISHHIRLPCSISEKSSTNRVSEPQETARTQEIAAGTCNSGIISQYLEKPETRSRPGQGLRWKQKLLRRP